jgi:hypothetical protein
VLLPSLAVLLSSITFALWVHANKRTRLKSFMDIRHNWVMVLPIILGLGLLFLVFFHDSIHCVTGNPIRELRSPRDTLQCIIRR